MPIAIRFRACYQLIDRNEPWCGSRHGAGADRGGAARGRAGPGARRCRGRVRGRGRHLPPPRAAQAPRCPLERIAAPLAVRLRRHGGLAEAPAPFVGRGSRPGAHTITAIASGCAAGCARRVRRPLADYELLELLLFFSVHRRDTKPIAKAMLEHLGGLGGVLAAEPARYAEFMGALPERRRTRAARGPRRRPALYPGAAQGGARAAAARAQGAASGATGDHLRRGAASPTSSLPCSTRPPSSSASCSSTARTS